MVCLNAFARFLKHSSPSFVPLTLLSYSLDVTVTKHIACNEKFVHLQVGLCKCQYLGALRPISLWWPVDQDKNIIFFNCYLAAPRPTLGPLKGTALDPNVTGSFVTSWVPKPGGVPSGV